MIEVLPLADKEVRAKLRDRVRTSGRPLLISQVRTDRFMRPVPEREPYASLERRFGDRVDQVVVADSGSVEGMWRDPLGELADALFPEDGARAYAAASGYLLIWKGKPLAVVKKHGAQADGWFLQDALHQAGLEVPAPDPSLRPGKKPAAAGSHQAQGTGKGTGWREGTGEAHGASSARSGGRADGAGWARSGGGTDGASSARSGGRTDGAGRARSGGRADSAGRARPGGPTDGSRAHEAGRTHRSSDAGPSSGSGQSASDASAHGEGRSRAGSEPAPAKDPYTLLGITPGMPRGEAKKAFRAMVALYHPDKVAHLAPEFQKLAEERTRELLAAWDEVEASLG
jgi:DnaJ-domain-containing protein 1